MAAIALCFVDLLLSSCATTNTNEKNETQVSLEILENAIGKEMDGKEVSLIKKAAVVNPEIFTSDDKKSVYFIWKPLGIELLFEDTKLRTVFLYAGDNKGRSAYRGHLPQDLIFSDTRSDVERKLGHPDYIGGKGVIDVWVVYKELRLGMTYKTLDLNDFNAAIDDLSIQ